MPLSAHHPFRSAKAKEEYLALYDRQARRWPVAAESKMVETSYGQTFVRIGGPLEAQPLVLLPGAYGNSLMWIPNIEAFSGGYRTYAVDSIYDIGRSIYTRHLRNSADYVRWLDEFFTALGLRDDIQLLGMSIGGWQAAQYAVRFPGRLARLVLLAPAGTVLPMRWEFVFRGFLSLLHRHFFKSVLEWVFQDLARKDETSLKRLKEATEEAFTAVRCFKPKLIPVPAVLKDQELQNLRVPALFVVGEQEKIYSAHKAVQRLKMVAPNIQTEIIPQAGHGLTYSQTELVNRRVLEFLKQP